VKILDSDHCVALLRGRLDLGGHVAPEEELATTSISVGELAHGAHKSQRTADNLARLDVLLTALVILPYDESAARQFGWLKAHLEQQGERLDDLDLQIASIAITQKALFLTHNLAHFERLARLAGVQIDDWLS
jgi:tRNA(fMet)-specific endonuclease VapC